MSTAKTLPKGLTLPKVEPRISTVADFIRATVKIIDERGWATGVRETEEGNVCLIGALTLVANPFTINKDDQVWAHCSYKELLDCHSRFGHLTDHQDSPLVVWNFSPEELDLIRVGAQTERVLIEAVGNENYFESYNGLWSWNDSQLWKHRKSFLSLFRTPTKQKIWKRHVRTTLLKIADKHDN